MKLGVWNIDCPAIKTKRSNRIAEIITEQDCDVLVLTEVNVALQSNRYNSIFCNELPFLNKTRNYDAPSKYHQVGIYSKLPIQKIETDEPINSVIGAVEYNNQTVKILGQVFTIKDRWAKWSSFTFKDRMQQQLQEIEKLSNDCFIACGDYNCRHDMSYNASAHNGLAALKQKTNFNWPTEKEDQTVQHILHSQHFKTNYQILEVGKLSDHPFLLCELQTIG